MKFLITGTSSGIGKSLYKKLSKDNDVLGLSRRITDTSEYSCDFSNLDNLQNICEDITKSHNDINFLILNAGTLGEIEKARELNIDEIKRVFDINVFSNKIIIDHCLKNCSSLKYVLAISSGAAFKGYDGWASYCMTKSSFVQMIKCYAIENRKVKFISLAPGVIRTKMQDKIINLSEEKFSSISKFKKLYDSIPTPDDMSEKFIKNFETIINIKSGDFFDMREIDD